MKEDQMSAGQVASVEAASVDRLSLARCQYLRDEVRILIVAAGAAAGGKQHGLSARQDLRPAVRVLTRFLIERSGRRRRASRRGNFVEGFAGVASEENRIVFAPGAAAVVGSIAKGDGGAALRGDFLQLAVGKEGDLLAVGREEGIARAFRAGEQRSRQLVEGADVELPLSGGIHGCEDDPRPVRREE